MHHTTTTGGPAGPRPSTRPPRHALVTLLATLAGSSAALWALTGPPAVPRFTGWPGLSDVLTGAAVEQAWLVALAAATAWLLIGYLAAIVVLRAALLAGQSLVGGTRWVRTGMWLSDLITVPAIRRIVDGGVAGVLFVSGSLSVPPRALPGPPPVPVLAAAVPHAEEAAAAPASPLTRPGAAHLEYTVVGGDSLWAIAERFYDDGARYLDLVVANPSILGDPAIIEPGWRLAIPLPVAGLEVTDVARYRVAAGDDLWSLAARFLGDGFRWPEIDVLNRGHVMSDGRVFADPNVIAPGWMIELPLTVRAAVSPSPVVTTPVPSATTDPAMPTTAPTVIATPEFCAMFVPIAPGKITVTATFVPSSSA